MKIVDRVRRTRKLRSIVPSCTLVFVALSLERVPNMAHILRLAEAINAEVYFIGEGPSRLKAPILTQSFARWREVKWRTFRTANAALSMLRRRGIRQIAVEISDRAIPFRDIQLKKGERIALIVGSETSGVDAAILSSIPEHVFLPMVGKSTCLNVGMALSIVAYHLTFGDNTASCRRVGPPPRPHQIGTQARIDYSPQPLLQSPFASSGHSSRSSGPRTRSANARVER